MVFGPLHRVVGYDYEMRRAIDVRQAVLSHTQSPVTTEPVKFLGVTGEEDPLYSWNRRISPTYVLVAIRPDKMSSVTCLDTNREAY